MKHIITALTVMAPLTAQAGCPPSQIGCTPKHVSPSKPAEFVGNDDVLASLGALIVPDLTQGQFGWSVAVAGSSAAVGLSYGLTDHTTLSVSATDGMVTFSIGGRF